MDKKLRLKRMQIIGKRRGSKELDIIFGRFIDYGLKELDDSLLGLFEEFLELNESDLYDYLFKIKIPPRKFRLILAKILSTTGSKT